MSPSYNMQNPEEVFCKDFTEFLSSEEFKKMYGYVWGCTKNEADTQDIIQNSIQKYCRHYMSQNKLVSKNPKLLWRIIDNTKVDHFRRESRKSALKKEYSYVTKTGSIKNPNAKNKHELKDSINNFFNELPKKHFEVLNLRYQGYSVKEIAEILGIRSTTVQTRLQRAREFVKEAIRKNPDQYDFLPLPSDKYNHISDKSHEYKNKQSVDGYLLPGSP